MLNPHLCGFNFIFYLLFNYAARPAEGFLSFPPLRMLGDKVGEQFDVCRVVVERRDVVVVRAAMLQKEGAVSHRHFFEGFEAVSGEAGADDTDVLVAVLREGTDGFVGVGLQPGFAAKARLVNEAVALGGQLECSGDGGDGRFALALVGIAFAAVARGQAVEGEEQLFGRAVGEGVAADAVSKRCDVARVGVPVAHQAQFGDAALVGECLGNAVEDAGSGGVAVLWVHRHDQQFFDTACGQVAQGAFDGWLTVTHGVCDVDMAEATGGEGATQGDGLPCGDGDERRAVFLPDLPVGVRGAFRAGVQDDAVQDGQPFPARQVDDAAVGEEFVEVGAQRFFGRRFGRAEVDEEDGDERGHWGGASDG